MTIDAENYSEQRVLREAELVDWGIAAEALAFVATAIASGVIGNAAYDVLKAKLEIYRQRQGDRKTAEAAVGTLRLLREKDPYLPEAVLKRQVVKLFSDAGLSIEPQDLPASPAKSVLPRANEPGPRWDFFLAHAGPDKPVVARVHAALTERGFRPFLDAVDIAPGARWTRALPDALRSSEVIVVFSSAAAEAAWFLEDEVVRAIGHLRRSGARVVPVYLDGRPEDDTRILYGLAALQALDLQRLGGEPELVEALVAVRNADLA